MIGSLSSRGLSLVVGPDAAAQVAAAHQEAHAVGDALAHAAYARLVAESGSTYTAWRWQERLHTPLARRALATELHAEHSVRWTIGELPDHKGVVLDETLIATSRRMIA